jgi:hypothetical protein
LGLGIYGTTPSRPGSLFHYPITALACRYTLSLLDSSALGARNDL